MCTETNRCTHTCKDWHTFTWAHTHTHTHTSQHKYPVSTHAFSQIMLRNPLMNTKHEHICTSITCVFMALQKPTHTMHGHIKAVKKGVNFLPINKSSVQAKDRTSVHRNNTFYIYDLYALRYNRLTAYSFHCNMCGSAQKCSLFERPQAGRVFC